MHVHRFQPDKPGNVPNKQGKWGKSIVNEK